MPAGFSAADFLYILPELVLTGGAMLVLLLSVLVPRRDDGVALSNEVMDHKSAVDMALWLRAKAPAPTAIATTAATFGPMLFVPGFMERDEGEREEPHDKYPWDGVSSVRPFHVFAKTTTVGVY